MVRSMDLVRKLLIIIESEYDGKHPLDHKDLYVDDYDKDVIKEHVKIMVEKKLVTNNQKSTSEFRHSPLRVEGLTWQGHDYLELIRDNEIWERTKNEIEEKKIPKSIENFASVAGSFFGGIIKSMND